MTKIELTDEELRYIISKLDWFILNGLLGDKLICENLITKLKGETK